MRNKIIITFAALVLAASPIFAAFDAFMKIDGIPGETQGTHPGWIHIDSFSWGMPHASASADTFTHPAAGGQGAGKAEVHDITITKNVDTSSPRLFQAAMNGRHFSNVVLDVNGQRTLLQDVIVTSVQKSPAMADGSVREIVHFNFARNATRESSPATDESLKPWQKVKVTANATISGDGGAPAAITLRSVRLVGQNSAIIVVCDAAGGMGVAGLQRAFLTRQRLPMLNIAARGQDATHKDFPATQFTFSNATITGNAAMGGGCNQMSLNFTRYAGPPTFIIIQGGRP